MRITTPAVYLSVFITASAYAQNPGDQFFPLPIIHKIELFFTQQNFWDSLMYYKQQGDQNGFYHYMPASVAINGTVLDSTAVRLKGNSSFNSYPGLKKSIKLDFNRFVAGQEYDHLQKLNLNNGFKDPTMLREKIMLDFCMENNIPAPRVAFARVYINGDYWGLYSVVEQIDDQFLKTWFSSDLGNLYKGDPHGSLKWISASESDYYPHYELKNNETINDWSDLVRLIQQINNTSPLQFHDSVQTMLNTDVFIKSWAASILFVNLDSYQGSGHNYYIYHDFYLDYFQWIIWDVNEAFGNFNMWGMNVTQLENLDILFIPNPPTQHPLTMKMIGDPDYRDQYAAVLCDMIHTAFTPEALFPLIDSLADTIRAAYYADPNKIYSNQMFEQNLTNDVQGNMGWIPGLKSFVSARQASVSDQLAGYGCWPLEAPLGKEETSPSAIAYPNPFTEHVTFMLTGRGYNPVLRIFNLRGEQLLERQFHHALSLHLTDVQFIQGMYFYEIDMGNGRLLKGKIISEK